MEFIGSADENRADFAENKNSASPQGDSAVTIFTYQDLRFPTLQDR